MKNENTIIKQIAKEFMYTCKQSKWHYRPCKKEESSQTFAQVRPATAELRGATRFGDVDEWTQCKQFFTILSNTMGKRSRYCFIHQ